jgi:hypothetical protein
VRRAIEFDDHEHLSRLGVIKGKIDMLAGDAVERCDVLARRLDQIGDSHLCQNSNV